MVLADMKIFTYIMALFAPLTATAGTLPVQISIGETVFAPVGEISLQKHLRTMSTPPYGVIIAREDMAAFGRFTATGVGQMMDISVCNQVVLSAIVQVGITNPYISIHNAPKGGLLDDFSENGCP